MLEIRAGMEPVRNGTTGIWLLTQNEQVGFYDGPGETGGMVKIMFTSPKLVKYVTLQITTREYLQVNEVRLLG